VSQYSRTKTRRRRGVNSGITMPSKVKKTGKSKSFHVSFLAVFTLVKVPQIIRRHV